MQISKRRINKTLEKQIQEMWLGVLADITTREEMEAVMSDLLTETERTVAIKRLAIALYLDKGRSYEDIKNNLKVSSATIANVAESLANPGYQELIRRIKADEWAGKWAGKIGKGLRRVLPI